MALTLQSEIRYLKGVGEAREALYRRLGIATVEDLLYHLPRDYLDLTRPLGVAEAPLGQKCVVRATVAQKGGEQRIRRGLSVFKVTALDGAAALRLTFYNTRYLVQSLEIGREYLFAGVMEGTLFSRQMTAPQVIPLAEAGGLLPVYPLTQGLTSRGVRKDVLTALEALGELPDTLPDALRLRYGLSTLDWAMRASHAPSGWEAVALARRRLVFEELLCLTLAFAQLRSGRDALRTSPIPPADLAPFLSSLPFTLTGAQRRAIDEAFGDLASGRPMNRLVQGDVGSGKTMVAAACCYDAARSGRQSAVMAPTEILAEQHSRTLAPLMERLGVRTALLTGSTPPAAKRKLKAELASGEIDLIIGTHALLTSDVAFRSLGLVVTDEQHRFGVGQRTGLKEKGDNPGVLVMSATPIPRTLALIIYGDLDLSVIDELPAGRQKIDTYLIDGAKRARAYGYIRQHLDRGLQAFIICPLVEQDEADPQTELAAAADYAETLARGPFAAYRVGLLHGRMKPKEKEAVMADFAAGRIDLLVSTTVIEVGIDVPNAAVMMVENAERFGLSQLHQLRGRVGRGTARSCCILLSDAKNEDTLARLKALCRTQDGFKIAEEDLKERGPGDFFGMRQHGLPEMKIADLAADAPTLALTQRAASELTPAMLAACPGLRRRVERMVRGFTL